MDSKIFNKYRDFLYKIKDTPIYKNGKVIFDMMFNNYMAASGSQKIKGDKNWYASCGFIIDKMSKETDLFPKYTENKRFYISKSNIF